MVANSKVVAHNERIVEKVVDPNEAASRLHRSGSILLLLFTLEILPVVINFAEGLHSPFFSPANINQHVYHHIHFLIYGFPVGLAIWLIMDWRVRELERKILSLSPTINMEQLAPKGRARIACWLPQTLLIFIFWLGWDDFKFHYVSRYWSLVHEILRLWH